MRMLVLNPSDFGSEPSTAKNDLGNSGGRFNTLMGSVSRTLKLHSSSQQTFIKLLL